MSTIASLIKIVSLPHGDAPEAVRRGWIGCVMPCEPECGHIPVYTKSVLPKKRSGLLTAAEFKALPPTQKINGFSVPQDIALLTLSCHAPLAAKWFYQHGFPHADQCFRFKLEETEVVRYCSEDELRGRPMVVYDDLERGTMQPIN